MHIVKSKLSLLGATCDSYLSGHGRPACVVLHASIRHSLPVTTHGDAVGPPPPPAVPAAAKQDSLIGNSDRTEAVPNRQPHDELAAEPPPDDEPATGQPAAEQEPEVRPDPEPDAA